MIEIHCALCEATAAVRAWDGAKLIQEVGVVAPMGTAVRGAARNCKRPRSQPLAMLIPSSEAMTIRANDIALRYLSQQLISVLEQRAALEELKRLHTRIAVVEVHLVTCKSTTAIRARDLAQRPQERRRAVLPRAISRSRFAA